MEKPLFEVVTSYQDQDGKTQYARLEYRGRMAWGKRTAEKHARDFKANHMRDAWAQDADLPMPSDKES